MSNLVYQHAAKKGQAAGFRGSHEKGAGQITRPFNRRRTYT